MNEDLMILSHNLKKDKYESFSRTFEEADEIFTLVRYNEEKFNSRMTKEYIILTHKYNNETKEVIEESSYFNDLSSLEEFIILESGSQTGRRSLLNMINNSEDNYENFFHNVDSIKNYAQSLNKKEIRRLKKFITSLYESVN